MKTISINFSQGLARQARVAQLCLLAVLLFAASASVVMLFRGTVSLVGYCITAP